jgi:hypothetical protein
MRTSKGLRVEYANQSHGWLKETVTERAQVEVYNQTWEVWVGDFGDEVILGLRPRYKSKLAAENARVPTPYG